MEKKKLARIEVALDRVDAVVCLLERRTLAPVSFATRAERLAARPRG
jgi:hypothetical protein